MEEDRKLRRELELDPPPLFTSSPSRKRMSTIRGKKSKSPNISQKETPIEERRRNKKEKITVKDLRAQTVRTQSKSQSKKSSQIEPIYENKFEPRDPKFGHNPEPSPDFSNSKPLESNRGVKREDPNPNVLISKSPQPSMNKIKDPRGNSQNASQKKKFDSERSERPKHLPPQKYKEEPASLQKFSEENSSRRMVNKKKNVRIEGIDISLDQDSLGSLGEFRKDTLPESEVERQRRRISEQLKLKDRERKRRDQEKINKRKAREMKRKTSEKHLEPEETFDERARNMQTNEFIKNFERSMDKDTSYSDNMNTEDMINQQDPRRRRIMNMTDMPQISPSRFKKPEAGGKKPSGAKADKHSSNDVIFVKGKPDPKLRPPHLRKKPQEPQIPERVSSQSKRRIDPKSDRIEDSLSKVDTTNVILVKDNARLKKEYEIVGPEGDLIRPKGLGKTHGVISAQNTPKRREGSAPRNPNNTEVNQPNKFGGAAKRRVPTFEERTGKGRNDLEESRKRRFYAGETPKEIDSTDSEDEMEYYERAYSEDKDLNLDDSEEQPHEIEYDGDPNLPMTSGYHGDPDFPNKQIDHPSRRDSRKPNTVNIEIEPRFVHESPKRTLQSENYIEEQPELENDSEFANTKDLNIPGYQRNNENSESEEDPESQTEEREVKNTGVAQAKAESIPRPPHSGSNLTEESFKTPSKPSTSENLRRRGTLSESEQTEYNLREDGIAQTNAFEEANSDKNPLFEALMSNPEIGNKPKTRPKSNFNIQNQKPIPAQNKRTSISKNLDPTNTQVQPTPSTNNKPQQTPNNNINDYRQTPSDNNQQTPTNKNDRQTPSHKNNRQTPPTPESNIDIPQFEQTNPDFKDLMNREAQVTPGIRTGSLSGTDTRITTPSNKATEAPNQQKVRSPPRKPQPPNFNKKEGPQEITLQNRGQTPMHNYDPDLTSEGLSGSRGNADLPAKVEKASVKTLEKPKESKEAPKIDESNLDFLNTVSATPNMKMIRKSNRKKKKRRRPKADPRYAGVQKPLEQPGSKAMPPSSLNQLPPVQPTPVHNYPSSHNRKHAPLQTGNQTPNPHYNSKPLVKEPYPTNNNRGTGDDTQNQGGYPAPNYFDNLTQPPYQQPPYQHLLAQQPFGNAHPMSIDRKPNQDAQAVGSQFPDHFAPIGGVTGPGAYHAKPSHKDFGNFIFI